MDVTVTYRPFWWEKCGIFTVVFCQGETRWYRLTLTGQVAFIMYFHNTISFVVLKPAYDFGMLLGKLKPP